MAAISNKNGVIEENLKNILNFGIGLLRTGEESLQTGLRTLLSGFEDLKQRGLQDNSQGAEKLRELLQNSLRNIEKLSTQAQENMNRVTAEAQKSYEKILKQAKSLLGEEQYAKLDAKLQETYSQTKKKAEEAYAKAGQFIDQIKENLSKVTAA